jgi:hypothetical protein
MYHTQSIQSIWQNSLLGGMTGDVLCGALLVKQTDNKVVYLQGITDYIYRIHDEQDSIVNLFNMLIDGDRMYRVLLEDTKGEIYKLIYSRLIYHWNCRGKQMWDSGEIELSKKCFIKELSTKWSVVSFLRFLRCYLPIFWPKK